MSARIEEWVAVVEASGTADAEAISAAQQASFGAVLRPRTTRLASVRTQPADIDQR